MRDDDARVDDNAVTIGRTNRRLQLPGLYNADPHVQRIARELEAWGNNLPVGSSAAPVGCSGAFQVASDDLSGEWVAHSNATVTDGLLCPLSAGLWVASVVVGMSGTAGNVYEVGAAGTPYHSPSSGVTQVLLGDDGTGRSSAAFLGYAAPDAGWFPTLLQVSGGADYYYLTVNIFAFRLAAVAI